MDIETSCLFLNRNFMQVGKDHLLTCMHDKKQVIHVPICVRPWFWQIFITRAFLVIFFVSMIYHQGLCCKSA